jgi:hypothetical protein
VFASNAQGFTSYNLSGANGVAYNPSTPLSALAPPSLLSVSTPLFAEVTNKTLHKTAETTAWNDVPPQFQAASSALQFTPVFDATAAWDADDLGNVYRWLLADGSQQSKQLGQPTSPPVLLQDGSALVVQKDGPVNVVSVAMATLKLVNLGQFAATPVTPVLDVRGSFGVAYVPAPGGWVYALQTPAPPMPAGSSAWPRPGRDSCNSRNLSSACE